MNYKKGYICVMKQNEVINRAARPAPKHVLEKRVCRNLDIAGVRSLVVGISGGADSTALSAALSAGDYEILAVHCNFHLRGEESDRDRDYCQRLCEKLGVKLEIIDFDVHSYMSQHNVSVEMACRELQYAEFHRLRTSYNADRIAVAHNAGDNAETVLMNLMRGGGVSGLRGMLPDTGTIIRPLLNTSRKEITDYLRKRGLEYMTDSTNLSSDFRRNFLRNEVIPLLETRWPEAVHSINRTAANMRQEERVLNLVEERIMETDITSLRYDTLKDFPEPLWIVNRFISRYGGTSAQANEIMRAIDAESFQTGKIWHVTGGRFVLERQSLDYIPDTGNDFRVETDTYPTTHGLSEEIRQSSNNYLWTSAAPDSIVFRHPATGDRIEPLGLAGSQLVSKVLKDAKCTRQEKESVVVAEDRESGRILWVEGLKRSRHLLADDKSETVYRYRIARSTK